MKRSRNVRLLSLLLVQLISILLLTVVNVGVPSPVHATDVATLSPVYKAFSNNMGGMVYEAHVVQASASFDGSTGFGGNSPQIYLSVLASLNNKFVGTPEPWYNIHKLRISVTIRDSSQNVLNPQENVKYTIGYNMWDSPYSTATDQDYANEFQDLVKYFQDLELGLVIPYPIPDLSSVKLPQPFNGVAKDTSSIWAQWATYPDSLFQAQSFPYSDPYHSIKLLVQPNFPKPDVYSISVSVLGERGSCDVGLILGPTTKPYICSADETLSTAYSFKYVYEADAGVDGDASNSLPNSGGTPRYIQHGSYMGILYGTDTADVYSFSTAASEKIVFTVTPPPSADFNLTVYDPSQTQIGTQDLGVGATNGVSFTASASSTYFAKISLVSGWGTYYITLSDTFQISANPSAVSLGLVATGSSATSTVSIASPTDFSGRVDLTTSITPSVANGPTASLSLGTTTVTQNPSSVSPLSSNPTSIMGYPVTCTRTLDKAFVQDGVFADFQVLDGSNTNTGTPNPCGAQYSYSVNIPTGATITAVQVIAVHQEDTYGTTLTVNVSPGSGTTQYSVSPFPSFDSWATTTLDVTAANMDFSSGSASVTWTVSGPYGLGGASRLDWLAMRVTYKMTAVNLTPGSSDSRVLTIASSTSTPAGVYIVSVTGTSGVVSFSTTVLASVTDFQVSANPVSVVILPGQTSTTSIMAYGLNGFTGTISLTDTYSSGLFCSGLTSYTISLTSTSTSGTSSVSCNGPPGSYSLTVTGSSGSQSRTAAPVALNVSDFVLTANPSSMTFSASSSANATIDVTALYGFRGLMNVSYSTPPGLTCDPPINMEPDPISMMCWGSPGSYTVTVTATSGAALRQIGGSLSHSTTVSVTVYPDFTISTSTPSPQFVTTGGSSTSTVTLKSFGFTGTVSLSTTITLNGSTCGTSACPTLSLNPPSIALTPGALTTATLTISTTSLTQRGTYLITVTGTSGSLSHSSSFTFPLLFIFRDDFNYPSTGGMTTAGWTVCGTLSQVTVGGGLLSLTNDGSTAGAMCWSNIPAAFSSWTVTDRGQYAQQLPAGGWTGGGTWLRVQTASHTYEWDLDGYYGQYYLFRDGVKVSITNGYTPQLGAWHDLTLDMRNGLLSMIADGKVIATYAESSSNNALIAVRMQPGWETVTNYDFVAINEVNPTQPADFIIGANPISLPAVAGSNVASTINLSSLGGFTGTVNLSSSSSPNGLTCTLSPASLTFNNSATSTLSCNGTGGVYALTVTGTSGFFVHTTTVTITDFTIQASPSSGSFLTGSKGNSTITVTGLNGFNNPVTLSTAISPSSGLTCSLNTYIYGSGTSALSCSSNTSGAYSVTVTGTSGSISHSVTVSFTVRGFSLTVTPGALTLPEGRTGSLTVKGVGINGYSGTVTLSATNYCQTFSFSKPTLQLSPGVNDSATLTITPTTNCPPSTMTQSVSGSDPASTATYNTYFILTTQDFSISATVTNVGIGGQTTLKYNVTYTDNNNYPGSIVSQSVSWGANNCCLTATVPSTFSIEMGDVTSASGVVTSLNVNGQPFSFPWDGDGFYAQGRVWIFFINYGTCSGTTSNCLSYATSTNGATWTVYNVGLLTASTPSFVTDGNNVYYVRYNGRDAQSGQALMFGRGALRTDGTIAWQPETMVKPATSGVFWYATSMRLSTTGQAFVAYMKATSAYGSGLPYVIHSNGLDYSTWQQDTSLTSSSDDWRFSLVPLPNGQMYLLYWPFWGGLRGRLWTGGVWGSEEMVTPTNTYTQQVAFGFSTGNSTVYAIWQERTSQKIQFAIRNGSWSSPQTIALADTGTNPHWTASYDPLHGKWYIIYYSSSTNQIYEYSGQPGNWSAKTVLFTTNGASSTTFIGSVYNSAPVNPSSNTLGIFWTQYDSSLTNLQLMFANTTIFAGGSFPATWLISSTGAGTGSTTLTISASDGYITRSLTIQISVNGYFVSVSPNPAGVYIGGSGATYIQVFPEYGIPLTNSTIVGASIPTCITLGTPNPRYFYVGPVTSLPYVYLPFSASSSCAAGNFPATVTIIGASTSAYKMNVTFTIWIQTPPSGGGGGGGGGGGSIAHGTLITMADGSLAPVQNLKVGDLILGYNPVTGQFGVSVVTSIKVVDTSNMLIIQTASGAPFRVDANPHQTLWVKTSNCQIGWMPVTQIKVGDFLWTQNGWTPVTSIGFAPAGSHVMYDIVATDYYFASGYLDPIYKM